MNDVELYLTTRLQEASMSRRFIEFVVSFVFIFLLTVYVTESIPWSILIALLSTWPLFVLWILCEIKHHKRCKKVPKSLTSLVIQRKLSILQKKSWNNVLGMEKLGSHELRIRRLVR
ncbi:MAG: hypothetical protein PWQ95_1807 [Thermococcaceae archaeon]|nr:hypothetical protein [Thermococcaceae archaeon]